MNLQPDLPIMFTAQNTVIQSHGEVIWAALCDNLPQSHFTLAEAAQALAGLPHSALPWSESTRKQYAKAVLTNVVIESGGEVVRRQGRVLWAWA